MNFDLVNFSPEKLLHWNEDRLYLVVTFFQENLKMEKNNYFFCLLPITIFFLFLKKRKGMHHHNAALFLPTTPPL